MEEASASGAGAHVEPVRSTAAVLGVLAAIIAVPLLALAFLAFGGRADGSGAAVVDALDRDAVHAVYLTNDFVYFGRLAETRGDFFELEDAYFLRRSPSPDDSTAAGDAPSDGETELVPVSQEVGGTGVLLVNAAEVVRIQTLEDDSEIVRTLEGGDED